MVTGMYFEDIEVGRTLTTKGRTITEADIVSFAGLTGDFNPLHTDAEYAKSSEYGQRIAHGALGLGVAIGLSYQLGFLEGTVIAFMSLEWKYRAPVFIGDTLHCEIAVTKTKPMPSAGGGLVVLDVKVLNQEDKVTQKGEWTVLVRSRPADDGDGDA